MCGGGGGGMSWIHWKFQRKLHVYFCEKKMYRYIQVDFQTDFHFNF